MILGGGTMTLQYLREQILGIPYPKKMFGAIDIQVCQLEKNGGFSGRKSTATTLLGHFSGHGADDGVSV